MTAHRLVHCLVHRASHILLAVSLLATASLLNGCAPEVVTQSVAEAQVQDVPGEESTAEPVEEPTAEPTEEAAEAPTDEAIEEPGDESTEEPPAAEGAPVPELTTQGVDAATAQPFAERALATLAESGVEPADVTSIQVEAVDWPDAGLGCPQPGQMYASVITPGYRIALDTGGDTGGGTGAESYAVHTSSRLDGPFVLCEQE